MRASDRWSRSRKPAAIGVTLILGPPPAEPERADRGIGSLPMTEVAYRGQNQPA